MKGETLALSPVGSQPYGPPVSVLVKRVLKPEEGRLIEETWHGSEYQRATLSQRGKPLLFDVRDEESSFDGSITLGSENWENASLSYSLKMTLKMSDGSRTLTGEVAWDQGVYRTQKHFLDPTQTPRAQIRQTLTLISPEAYAASRAAVAFGEVQARSESPASPPSSTL